MKIHKTNAARILDQAGITYALVPYEVDEDDLSAIHMAQQLGQDIDTVFKTLVLRTDKNGFLVCVIPGGDELDLKKAAKAAGCKSCSMLPMKELQSVTGYIRGGCSPLGMKKQFSTLFHETALLFEEIFVSAGQRGLQLRIAPDALIAATKAQVTDLVRDGE